VAHGAVIILEDIVPDSVTELLIAWNRGDEAALGELMPLVFDELRVLAGVYLNRERPGHTLQPTALVNEVYLRLVDQQRVSWENRAHFFGMTARMMRRLLVNHAEARRSQKRGGGAQKVSLDEVLLPGCAPEVDVLAIDLALQELEKLDARQGQVVEMRFFSGLSIAETAEALQISPATVKRDWETAKLWLRRRMAESA
jgi:RNA polymerase sigma factor (TIGR02999 family)